MDPSGYHIITKNGRKNLILAGILFFVLVVPLFFYVYYKVGVNRPSQTDREITYEIKKGDSVFDVAEGLYTRDAINSKFLFIFYLFANRLDKSIQAGVYTIKAGSTISSVTEQFLHGKNDVKVTFLEGWRVEEYARAAQKLLGDIDYNKFVTAAKPYEGYLFPDTYFFNKNVPLEELIKELRDNFDNKTSGILTSENLEKVGLTKEQAVIFASIVEREVTNDADRKLVAGILIKRWKEEMKLDADATVQYAVAFTKSCGAVDYCTVDALIQDERDVDWWPNTLTAEDLAVESPYNSRKNVGLPPTPISSVSEASIEAVVNPVKSDYYFYLHDLQGQIHYAKTLEEHNANIQHFLAQ